MEDYIEQSRKAREVCEDFLAANPAVHSVVIPTVKQQGDQMSTLVQQIINLPSTPDKSAGINYVLAYDVGHKHARHAAAELAVIAMHRVAYRIKDLEATNRQLKEQLHYMMRDQAVKDAKIKMLDGANPTPDGWTRSEDGRLHPPAGFVADALAALNDTPGS